MPILLPSSGGNAQPLSAPPEASLSLTGADLFRQTAFLSTVASAGFRHVELGGGPGELGRPGRMVGLALTELQKSLRDGGLSATSILSLASVGSSRAPCRQAARDTLLSTIDLAHSLGCPLVVLGNEKGTGSAEDAVRYALDVLHDVDTALGRSGVRLALRGCGQHSFLADARARTTLLREAPGSVGLSLADQDLATSALSSDAVVPLTARAYRAGLSVHEVARQGLILSEETAARNLLGGLSMNGFSGSLAVVPTLNFPNRQELKELYAALLHFIPSACLAQ